ncbi:MAG: lamin tail domain-containing protein [Luteolibacter sp.]|uniref:lamin tail domain-containing protein n=1 Tax=Luteolibacter sp. TaxID=1962973 RepID=UPI0032665C7E
MRFLARTGIFSILLAWQVSANPVITEFMADNETTLPDENGDFSDWIEIHNPATTPFALAGWYLTDSATNLTKWQFPTVSLQPGEFLVVWASSKNRRVPGAPLHTNFSLSKGGEFLALVRPDGTTAEQSFAPSFPAQAADESYGLRFLSTTLVPGNATGRYKIPTSTTNPTASWNQASFSHATWASGPGGFGFGITVPGITVRQVSKNGSMGGLNDAIALIALPETDPTVLSSHTAVFDMVNFLGEGSDGRYAQNSILPGGGGDNYAAVATGFVTIPTTGTYTFGLNSDDGGRILIDGTEIMRDDSFHAPQDAFGSISLTAGTHTFQALMFEGGYGDCFEFFAAPGNLTSFDPGVFRLVGDVANGGLAATTTPPGAGGLIGTDLKTLMAGRADAFVRMPFTGTGPGTATTGSLVMRYNDGFAAWLNGNAVASANAPASPAWSSLATATRTNDQTLRKQAFNLTAALPLILNGSNVLAIQGLNSATTDTTFLVSPELVIGSLDAAAAPASYGGGLATPGWINGAPSSLGNVADTQFSVKRGFFTAPISVAITSTTPGAVIRYTTDGSTPSDTNGTIYTAPLAISSTTVVRARGSLTGWVPTNLDTQTYLFPNDILTQSADGSPAPGWPATSGTSQVLDFGMDPDIVNHTNPEIGGAASVKAALLALPSISVTTDLPNLFDINGSQGIYAHPDARGFAWERPASMEWITPPDAAHPNGTSEFQINAGVRLRGGFSRSSENPKHAFRFFFREEYGSSKLKYPLFGRDAAQDFDKIDLRTAQNYSWSFGGDDRNTFLREESCRQALLDLGQPGSHVRYAHLYLNGRYWGLYVLDERTESAFSESYLGGNKDDYDVVKSEGEAGFVTGATDGNLTAWQELWSKGETVRASPTNENYFRLMGLATDGVTPTADPVLLDADSLIDYLLLTFWTGNLDGCVSAFLGNEYANNWYGSRRRVGNPRQGFRFFVHDFEHTMLDVNENRTGPFTSANESNVVYSNPLYLHQDLIGNEEYRMRWADLIHCHLFNDGRLTPDAWHNRINKLAAVVDTAIIAESARWGDSNPTVLRTKQDWLNAQNWLLGYLSPRNAVILDQLRADNLYPNLDAPVLSPYGGHQPVGVEISVQGPASSTLHYMADGSDPRAIGGALRAGALTYNASTTNEALVPMSASGWKYLGNGSDLGIVWRMDGFNDSAWPTGTAELGYGDGDETTAVPIVDVNPGSAGVQKAATCYFRRTFTVANASQITSLALSAEYDDSYAVYLNGTRVAGNLPIDPAYNYYSGSAIEDTITNTAVSPGLLRNGTNTICIEVHQANDFSSDLSMNLSLTGTRAATATPLFLTGTGEHTLRFRALSGTTWSALSESTYQVGTVLPTAAELVVSEISYFPQDPNGAAEFVELLNTSTTATLDLGGARFTDGIDFTFPANTNLAPEGRVLVVKDVATFEALYGTGKPIAGIFLNGSALSNTGEHLRLEAADGSQLLDFSYAAAFPWPASANGLGRSMILTNYSDPSDPLSWRPSAGANGNPGNGDSFARAPGQSLLDYALGGSLPSFDAANGNFSATRRLGADAATLRPEWSTDLGQWFTQSLILTSETPDAAGNSTLQWKLDPVPPGKAFIRLRVAEKP